jgi:hypothetical protein
MPRTRARAWRRTSKRPSGSSLSCACRQFRMPLPRCGNLVRSAIQHLRRSDCLVHYFEAIDVMHVLGHLSALVALGDDEVARKQRVGEWRPGSTLRNRRHRERVGSGHSTVFGKHRSTTTRTDAVRGARATRSSPGQRRHRERRQDGDRSTSRGSRATLGGRPRTSAPVRSIVLINACTLSGSTSRAAMWRTSGERHAGTAPETAHRVIRPWSTPPPGDRRPAPARRSANAPTAVTAPLMAPRRVTRTHRGTRYPSHRWNRRASLVRPLRTALPRPGRRQRTS